MSKGSREAVGWLTGQPRLCLGLRQPLLPAGALVSVHIKGFRRLLTDDESTVLLDYLQRLSGRDPIRSFHLMHDGVLLELLAKDDSGKCFMDPITEEVALCLQWCPVQVPDEMKELMVKADAYPQRRHAARRALKIQGH